MRNIERQNRTAVGSGEYHIPHALWAGAGSEIGPEVQAGPGCVVGRGARLAGKVCLGRNVQVGDNVTLAGPLVVGDDCQIGRGAQVGIFSGGRQNLLTLIGSGSQVGREVIIWAGVKVGEAVFIKADTMLEGDAPHHALVGGQEGVLLDYLCPCGGPLKPQAQSVWTCQVCHRPIKTAELDLKKLGHVLGPGSAIGPRAVCPSMYITWMGLQEF